jgi:hypothetical protein
VRYGYTVPWIPSAVLLGALLLLLIVPVFAMAALAAVLLLALVAAPAAIVASLFVVTLVARGRWQALARTWRRDVEPRSRPAPRAAVVVHSTTNRR